MLEARRSPIHGRGVYATHPLDAGTLVATCPALLVDNDTRLAVGGSALAGMFVDWDDDGTGALPLGVISLLNHTEDPNVELHLVDDDEVGPTVEVWSIRDVDAGEELTLDYLAGSTDGELWFHPAD